MYAKGQLMRCLGVAGDIHTETEVWILPLLGSIACNIENMI